MKAQPKILKKVSEHQIYKSKRKCSQKNYVSYFKSGKEPKICIGATQGNLQVRPKILKTNQLIRTKNFQKKIYLVS
jgi:hypothetical protein